MTTQQTIASDSSLFTSARRRALLSFDDGEYLAPHEKAPISWSAYGSDHADALLKLGGGAR